MIVLINNQSVELLAEPSGQVSLADAIRAAGAMPPFAVAVNLQFIPGSQYAKTVLQANDKIEIIRPVTGG